MTPEWIQAITSVLTFLAAVAAGIFAGKAAIYTKQQAQASDEQVRIASDALEITRKQASAAESHGSHQVRLAREQLEVARVQAEDAQAAAKRQIEEAQASFRRYEEARLDAIIPVVLITARRPGAFVEMRRKTELGDWPVNWSNVEAVMHVEENQQDEVMFRIRLDVVIENVSDQIARIDVTDFARGKSDIKSGRSIIIRPRDTALFKWYRTFTPRMLSSQIEVDSPANWLFDLTLWVRDLGMNVKDIYKFNSDLRLFRRDGTRLVVLPEPEHTWQENVAQPLQRREYDRLATDHSGSLGLSGHGSLS